MKIAFFPDDMIVHKENPKKSKEEKKKKTTLGLMSKLNIFIR